MLKTADVLDAHRLSAPMPTVTASEGLRRLTATTALATGVIVGMMLFQPNAAQAQSIWTGATANYGTATNWNPNAVATGGVAGVFDNSVGAGSAIVDLGAATFTPSTWTINGSTAFTFQNGTANFTGGGLTNNSSANQTISAILGGAGSVVQSGPGTLTLSGVNTYTGGTTVSAGQLTVGNASALGNVANATGVTGGVLDLGGFTVTQNGGLVLQGGIVQNGTFTSNGTFDLQNGVSTAILAGAGAVSKTTAGAVTLSGANTYTGGTTVSAGTLTLSGVGTTLGASANALTVSGGTLDLGTLNITQNGGLTLTGGTISNGTLTSSGAFGVQAGSVDAVLAGGAGLTKTTGGTVTLTGANSYTGATTISAGVLNIQNATALGTTAAGTTVAAGAALELQGAITIGAEALSLNGDGVASGGALRNISGTNGYGGVITLASTARINADAGGQLNITGNITGAGQDLTVGGAGTINIIGNVTTGAGAFTKDGAGNVQLGGTNTYTGVTTVNGGFLILVNGAAIADAGAVVINALGQVNLFSSETVGSLAGNGGILLSSGSTLTTGDATSTVFSGSINEQVGAGNLVKQGAGTFTLSGANTYSGTTTINAGVLNIQNATALGTTAGGTTVANGAALQIQGNIAVGAEALSLSGTGIANDGALRNISGTNSFAGAITLASASRINSDAGTLTLSGGITGAFALTVGGVGNTTISGAIATGANTLTKDGAGLLVLSGANTYTGATTINGGELRVNGSLGATAVAVNNTGTLSGIGTIGGAVTVNNGGTLSAGQSPGTLIVGSLTLNAGSNSVFELNTPGAVGGVTNDLVISNGPVQLGGTLTATAASAGFYRLINVVGGGAITGNYATVTVAGFTGQVYTNAPGAAEQVNLAVLGAGQIMQFWDGADTLGNGTVDGGPGTWNAANTNWTGLPGQAGVNASWQSSVGVFQGTAGVVTVAGTQAFDTLQFNVDGYTLNGGQLGIGVAGGGTINVNGPGLTATINSAIVDGVGTSLIKVGTGTLNLGGVNTYTGGTTVSDGTLGLLAGGVLASNVTVAAAGTFNNAGTVNASVINSGTTNNSGLIAGSVTNSGTLTTTGTIQSGVTNSGTVNAAGTINGAIANNAGTFTVAGVLAGNGAFSNAGGAILAVNGGNFTGLASLVNAGSVTIGAGRTLSVGTITNNAGTIALDVGAILQGTANTLNNAATINVGTNGAILDAGAINNLASGVINFNGPGGTATLSSGLQVNNAGAINLIGGNLNVAGPLSNSGQVTIAANLAANLASLSNAGSVSLGQGARLTTSGNLANTGMIDLRNGATNNLVTVGGGWSGNGRVGLDLDIVNAAADRISVVGASSGLTTVSFAQLTSTSAVLNRDVLVVNGAAGAQFVAANALTPTGPSPFPNGGGQLITNNGLVQYWFGEATPGSGNYVVRPDLNVVAATGFVASVSSALSSINAFSEPASAFINGPSDPKPNTFSLGTWGRARGGRFDITSNSTVGSLGGVSRSFRSVNEAGFNGFQLGIDAGLYNINGTGWTANLGVHGGKVDAKVTTPDTRLEVEQPFYGLYGAVRSGSGFALDVLVRRDNFDLKLNSASAGITNAKFKADGWSGLASMSQRFNITDSIYIDPSVALLYSRAEVDLLRTLQANVSWQPIESVTGRFGVQLGTFIQPTETIVLAPYIAASVWREFAGKSKASGEIGGLSFPTTTDRVGTYGQFSAGMAVSSTTPGLSGFVRADLRFGERIEGYAFNGGLRYQF
ncbi:autotransporter-associated beta strand repeat-containing protein [Bosea sp. 685]|uniref:autotransporter-associated beta strand repeat-containing protein n=1 Tax=Bosea sp. 685 TaxID=3080057 RepID=UPI002892DBE0|nr:autotransporter-associated beta strand repeat-containing protein [Bosea sp. 685]WNJ92486.1 autotransporter-associated beta strand repeat-containing protein [Bosea sp. 685]